VFFDPCEGSNMPPITKGNTIANKNLEEIWLPMGPLLFHNTLDDFYLKTWTIIK
jgi:hypothetical protein